MVKHIWYLIKLLFISKKKFNYFIYSTIGYLPRNIKLFETAFIHKSASLRTQGARINNERLEYLGDAILDAVVAEYLFGQYPDESEGFLTKLKSKLVNRKQLDNVAYLLGFEQFIVAHTNNSIDNTHIHGNAFEALIGAIFLDKGYNQTKKFITEKVLGKCIDVENLESNTSDFKSQLLEWGQKNKFEIVFNTKEDEKHTDSKPLFYSEIIFDDAVIGTGTGKSKKEAEKNASKEALSAISDYNSLD